MLKPVFSDYCALSDMPNKIRTMDRELMTREFSLDPADKTAAGRYRAVIAVNDDVGDGRPINLRGMSLDAYRKNPIVLLNHDRFDRSLPIARTTNIEWTNRGLEAEFEFLPGDDNANRVRNAWDRGFLRAASVSARPVDQGGQGGLPGIPTKHELIEWSIVAVPADVDSVRSVHRSAINEILLPPPEDVKMDEKEIQATVEAAVKRSLEALDKGGALDKPNEAMLTERMAAIVKGEVNAALKQRDDAVTAQAKAEADAKASAERASADAESRADLLVTVRGLVPDGTVTKGKSTHDLLVLAAGDEVTDAANRSDDYLLAKVETIVERRAAAANGPGMGYRSASPTGGAPKLSRPMTVMQMQRLDAAGSH